ncbi:hypothetical protein Val02_49030 [Virgisporangium aliadipatigenens]|uniref:Right handed beta helix domain-containing protein n=1 Tax=Virgisporangium aliadipatigenens TaxID=741659 RepID=A0A8J3YP67_9ACTN|nr:hypothetical protein [Virgisporangium aliadipatigenens]GIJ48017.1 hypothetical protein Val02_49030 [Virgisporangium aliadipatigenens]
MHTPASLPTDRLARVPLSRQAFLRLALAGTAAGVLTGTRPEAAAAAAATPAPQLGIAPGNDARTNRDNLVRALTNSTASVFFPPGDYRLDNSAAANDGRSALLIENFAGTLEMQNGAADSTPTARLVFTDPRQGGLYLHYARYSPGATLIGVHATYAALPTIREEHSKGNITFDNAISPTVRRLNVRGSTGGGLVFWVCRTPSVDDAVVADTMADGVHFANCQDGYGNNIRCKNTGDDGISFVSYTGGPANTGGLLTNSSVTDSRTRGITVIGQSDVTVDHFGVNWSAVAGLLVDRDGYADRTPRNVVFQNGFVYHGGGVTIPANPTNRYGIELADGDEVRLHHITVRDSHSRALTSTATGTVRISRLAIENAGKSGVNLTNGRHYITDVDGEPGITVTGSDNAGFVMTGSELLRYDTIVVADASRTDNLRRAFDFNGNKDIQGGTLRVIDDKNPATGYIVGAYGANTGHLGRIEHRAPHPPAGVPRVQNQSGSSLTYVLA